MGVDAHGTPRRQARELLGLRARMDQEGVRATKPVRREGAVERRALVRRDVVAQVDPDGGRGPTALPARGARGGSEGGPEEGMPPRNHQEIGRELPQPRAGAKPGDGVDGIQDRLRGDRRLDRVPARVELGRAGEEKPGIETSKGEDREVVPPGQSPREKRRVMRDPAPVRVRGSQDRGLQRIVFPRGRTRVSLGWRSRARGCACSR